MFLLCLSRMFISRRKQSSRVSYVPDQRIAIAVVCLPSGRLEDRDSQTLGEELDELLSSQSFLPWR